jgi:PAS domain S-box-containing protein
MERAVQRAIEHGEPFDVELGIITARGNLRWVHAIGKADLERRRVTGFFQDITERKRAEEALRESEERYRRVSSVISDIAYSCQAAEAGGYRIDWLTGATERITGYSADELMAKRCWRWLVIEEDRALFDKHVLGLVPGSSGFCELRVRHGDGSVRWLASSAECALSADVHRAARLYGGLVDITARKALEAQLQQAQKMESIGRLAGGVAHDFNNLLTVINGYSQLLLAKLSAGDPLRAGLVEISKAGERAAGLTRQLLAFSRRQVLEPRVLDLNQVVEEMRSMLGRVVGEDVDVRIALHAEAGMVHVDPHQLEQVLMNVVVNARDAMPGGGKMLIETARVGRYVMLAVSDNGVGMDGETRQQIFEPFFTTKGVGKGTGLGLSMVQGIVAQSGGHIDVYSELGQGTTFKIYLPAPAGAAADAGKPAAVAALGGKETVLVVEDQAEVRAYAVAVLKAYGYRVIEAENAGEALLLCERDGPRIDLVLTDVVMPNVSGRELAQQLEKHQPGIQVLFMSGYTDDAIVHHGVLEEGAEFIQKPFSPEQLAGKIRAVLSSQ